MDSNPGIRPYCPLVSLLLCKRLSKRVTRQKSNDYFRLKLEPVKALTDKMLALPCAVFPRSEQSTQPTNNIVIPFGELNEEDSDTLFRAWKTVSTSKTAHRRSV